MKENKHQKELNRNKSVISNLEREMRNLRRGIDNVEKEKSQMKEQIERKADSDSVYLTNKVNSKDKDTPNSHDEYEFYSKHTSSNATAKVKKIFYSYCSR